MTKIASLFVATLLALSCHTVSAQTQLARTYVSSLGNDAYDCNRLTHCRTFQRAHDTTLANGEITVLDPGGYGAVTITKTISIINDGVGEAGIRCRGAPSASASMRAPMTGSVCAASPSRESASAVELACDSP